MFEAGDVVRFQSPTAGKLKFHLCLGDFPDGPRFAFLHLNSGDGFKGDCVLDDGQIPGLPPSPTGLTVVSFSTIVRMGPANLVKFRAIKTGQIDPHMAGELAAFAKTVTVLTRSDRRLVVDALEALF